MDREVPGQDLPLHMQHHSAHPSSLISANNDHSEKLMPNENNNTSLKNNNSSNSNNNSSHTKNMKNGHSNNLSHCNSNNNNNGLSSNNSSSGASSCAKATANGTSSGSSSSLSSSSSTSSTSSNNSKRFCNGGSTGAGGILPEQRRLVDVTRDKPVKVTVRVVVPTRDHPKFNFVGKLLGPQGNSLKRLQEETMTKMAILGRGSMRDRQKEEELRLSGDPKFCHLQLELHVEVTALAPPAEAHARIALALAEVRRFLVPDFNDDIRQEQMWELHVLKSSRDHLKHLASGPASAACPSPQEDAVAAAAAAAGLSAAPMPHGPHAAADPTSCLEAGVGNPGALTAPLAPGPSRALHSPIGPDVAARLFCPRTAATGGGRKRPYIAMSPTKRTVLSILARARAAQAKDMIGAH